MTTGFAFPVRKSSLLSETAAMLQSPGFTSFVMVLAFVGFALSAHYAKPRDYNAWERPSLAPYASNR
jgi:hypothetical protein